MQTHVFRAALITLFAVPFFALAQTNDDALRAAIRADIMSDPRSSEMSPTELNALVNALAVQAEDQGVAAEYLDAQNSFEEDVEIPVYYPSSTTNPLAIAIGFLVIVVIVVSALMLARRKAHRKNAPSSGMVA